MAERRKATNHVTLAETAVGLLQVEKASGRATVRSLGVIYALALGGIDPEATEAWKAINQLVVLGVVNEARYLENVQQVAWATYNAFVTRPRGTC